MIADLTYRASTADPRPRAASSPTACDGCDRAAAHYRVGPVVLCADCYVKFARGAWLETK